MLCLVDFYFFDYYLFSKDFSCCEILFYFNCLFSGKVQPSLTCYIWLIFTSSTTIFFSRIFLVCEILFYFNCLFSGKVQPSLTCYVWLIFTSSTSIFFSRIFLVCEIIFCLFSGKVQPSLTFNKLIFLVWLVTTLRLFPFLKVFLVCGIFYYIKMARFCPRTQ